MDNKTFQELHKNEEDVIQSDSSYWIMINNVATTLPSIFVVFFFIGSWGDKVDRKLPVLLPCLGATITNLCHLLNSYFMDWPLRVLVTGHVFGGLFGGYITLLMGVYSYITHVAEPSQKTVRVGIVESMVFLAGTISVFVSGLLLKAVGFAAVFGILAGCTGNCCHLWFLDSLKDTFICMRRSRPDRSKAMIVLQLLILNIMQMCTTGENDILFLYLKRSPRSFSSTQYGYFKGTENFTRCLALVTLLPVLMHLLKMQNTSVVMLGIVSKAAGLIWLGLADTLILVFTVVVFAALQGFPAAALRSNMSSMVDKDEQGRLFSLVAATESCVTLATTFIFNGWYPKTLSTFDGTCFEFAAGMCGLALLLTICLRVLMRSNEGTYDMEKTVSATPTSRLADSMKEEKQGENYKAI